jgi:hypothetical protein
MHRTNGDGFILDPIKNVPVYADEDLPTRQATQLRHQEMNAIQEEICNVIEDAFITVNQPTEDISQMNQLNQAIDWKLGKLSQAIWTNLYASSVKNNSLVPGTNLQEVLDTLAAVSIHYKSTNVGDFLDNLASNYTSPGVVSSANVSISTPFGALSTTRIEFKAGQCILRAFSNLSSQKIYIQPQRKMVLNAGQSGYQAFSPGHEGGAFISNNGSPLPVHGTWLTSYAIKGAAEPLEYFVTDVVNGVTVAKNSYKSYFPTANLDDIGVCPLGLVQIISDGSLFKIKPFIQNDNSYKWKDSVTAPGGSLPSDGTETFISLGAGGAFSGHGYLFPVSTAIEKELDMQLILTSSATSVGISKFYAVQDNVMADKSQYHRFLGEGNFSMNIITNSENISGSLLLPTTHPVDVSTNIRGFKLLTSLE